MAGIDFAFWIDHMTEMTPATPTPAAKPKPRPRPQVMKLTDAAAQRITELTKRADSEIVGLRVGIKNGGCAGQSYTVEYAHEIRATDEVVEDKGVKMRLHGAYFGVAEGSLFVLDQATKEFRSVKDQASS